MITFCISALVFFLLFSVLRLLLGPSVWDRLLAFNLMSIKITLLIALFAVVSGRNVLLDLALVYVLLNIIGLLFICRFIERKGDI